MFGDAAALEQDSAARHFGGMSGENGCDFYLAQNGQGLVGVDSGGAHALQRAPERTFQRRLLGMQFGGAAAAFAMSGLRKIGEFEVDGESFGDAVSLFDGQARDNLPRLAQQRILKSRWHSEVRSCSLRRAAARDAE